MSTTTDAQSTPPTPKRARWKRWLKWATVLLVVVIGCLALLVKDHVRTLASLRHVPNTNLYVMDYYGRYHMDEIRAHGVDVTQIDNSILAAFFPDVVMPVARAWKDDYVPETPQALPVAEGHHCTTAAVRTADGGALVGRNFDWKHNACLVVKIHGQDATSSVAVIDLAYLNMDRGDLTDTHLWERIPLLFAPYFVQDGMNQYGVAVSTMSVSDVRPPYDESKPDITLSTAMRLMLDYARSTDEAIAILNDYNIHFVESTGHLLVGDKGGDFAVVEFIDGDIKVTRPSEGWQVCTNHRIWGKTEEENDGACRRYRLVSERLAELGGEATATDVMQTMAAASAENWTMWTSVYDLTSGRFRVAYRRQYDDWYADRMPQQ